MKELGMCVIDAGHFNTEKILVPKLVNLISDKFKDIEVISNNVENDPFKFV